MPVSHLKCCHVTDRVRPRSPPGIRAAWFLRYGIRERKLTNDDTHMGKKTTLLPFAVPTGRSNQVRCSITPTRKLRRAAAMLRKVSSQNNQADRRSRKGRMARTSEQMPTVNAIGGLGTSVACIPLHRQLWSSSLCEIGGIALREIRGSFANLAT